MVHRRINSTKNGGPSERETRPPTLIDLAGASYPWTEAFAGVPHSWRSTLRVALLLALVVAGVVIIVATTRLLELSAIPGLILYGMPRRRTG